MVSRFTWAGSGITKAKKQNNQKKRFISHYLNFLLALLLKKRCEKYLLILIDAHAGHELLNEPKKQRESVAGWA